MGIVWAPAGAALGVATRYKAGGTGDLQEYLLAWFSRYFVSARKGTLWARSLEQQPNQCLPILAANQSHHIRFWLIYPV